MNKPGDKPNAQAKDAVSDGVGAGLVGQASNAAPDQPGETLDVADVLADGAGHDIDAPIDSEIQRHLGLRLKAAYAELVEQPIPDSFLELLAELERKERRG